MILRNFILSWAISISVSAFASPLQEALREYGVTVSSENFKVLKDQKISGNKIQRLIEVEGRRNERIEIKIVSPVEAAAARAMMDSERTVLKKLYAAPQTPYMGDIAQAIGSCPSKYGPLKKEMTFLAGKQDVLIGAATPERTFGACTSDQAKYRGAYVSYYHPATKTVWSWRISAPWTDGKPLGSEWLSDILAQFKNEISVP